MEPGCGLVREVNASFDGRYALRALRWSYCAFIAAASIAAAHGPKVIVALAVTETLAAIAFAIEPAEVIACAVLLLSLLRRRCCVGGVRRLGGDIALHFLRADCDIHRPCLPCNKKATLLAA
jgi:hypothetical protein